ncbi:hypothetical protein [Microvirga sp.]|uniref:hypothetical protein n=1 Tax=Microvirga sp. TaxID=1873136 RepID=UPI001FEF56FA|nr:hypothetical protein [Microvirga sp.]
MDLHAQGHRFCIEVPILIGIPLLETDIPVRNAEEYVLVSTDPRDIGLPINERSGRHSLRSLIERNPRRIPEAQNGLGKVQGVLSLALGFSQNGMKVVVGYEIVCIGREDELS